MTTSQLERASRSQRILEAIAKIDHEQAMLKATYGSVARSVAEAYLANSETGVPSFDEYWQRLRGLEAIAAGLAALAIAAEYEEVTAQLAESRARLVALQAAYKDREREYQVASRSRPSGIDGQIAWQAASREASVKFSDAKQLHDQARNDSYAAGSRKSELERLYPSLLLTSNVGHV